MASELITDDFNRGDQELNGSVSAEGWAWEKMFTSASFLRIDADAGKDDTPGVQNGSGIFFRLYRAAEQIASPFVGAQVDVSRSIAGGGVALAIKVQDQNNFYFMDFLHSTGLLRVFEKVSAAFTLLGSDTITPPTPPYTIAFYWAGGAPGVVIDGTLVLGGDLGNVDAPSIETLLFDSYAAIGMNSQTNVRYDNFQAGLPWLLSTGVSAPSTADESNPNVQRSILDEQRRANLMGGRASTILTSALGLDDDVPTARIHLMGRCGLRPAVQVVGGGDTDIEGAGTTVSPTFHASTKSGHTVFASIMHRSAVTPPTGWNLVATMANAGSSGFSQSVSVYRKIYETGDGASVTFTQAASGRMIGHCVTVRPQDASSITVLDTATGDYAATAEPGLHPIQGVQGTATGQIVLSASTCSLAETGGAATSYTAAGGWTQTTTVSVAENRLMVAHKAAPTDAPVSGAHSHGPETHDGAEISILLGVSA